MLKNKQNQNFKKKNLINQYTDADVALASNGKSPPHALHNISAIWDIIWTILTQNIWLSVLLIESVIGLVGSLEGKTRRIMEFFFRI